MRVLGMDRVASLIAPFLLLSACDEPGPLSAAAKGHLPPTPAPPAWSAGLQDQPLVSVLPGEIVCLGAVDLLADRYAGARKVIGWAWNRSEAQPVARLVAIDEQGRIVGFGEGGTPRADVPRVVQEVQSDSSGWQLITWAAPGQRVQIYGVGAADASACRIGEIEIRR